MIIDFDFSGRKVFIFGGGGEGLRRAKAFLLAGAKVTVVSEQFASGLITLHRRGRIRLVEMNIRRDKEFLKNLKLKTDVIVAATDNPKMNKFLVGQGKRLGCLVYAVDDPSLSDFKHLALSRVGQITIGVSTDGHSPAVAKLLMARIKRIIKPEDAFLVGLMNRARTRFKKFLKDPRTRKKAVYTVLQNPEIKKLLAEGKRKAAEELMANLIAGFQRS